MLIIASISIETTGGTSAIPAIKNVANSPIIDRINSDQRMAFRLL